jgi:hypothetical protein
MSPFLQEHIALRSLLHGLLPLKVHRAQAALLEAVAGVAQEGSEAVLPQCREARQRMVAGLGKWKCVDL